VVELVAEKISRLWGFFFGRRESRTSIMTEEQLLDNWIPHDHVWGESGPVPRDGLGEGYTNPISEKSSWEADLVIDDSAAPVLLQILRSDAEAGFSNDEKKSPVYSSTSDLLVRIIGRERLDIFERDLQRLPSWIDWDERFFAPCYYCEQLEPTGYGKDGKSHHCDDCWEGECDAHDHCKECNNCEIFHVIRSNGICYDCHDAHEEEEERRQEAEDEEAARRKEDQDWKDEFEPDDW